MHQKKEATRLSRSGLASSKLILSDVEFRSEIIYFIVVDRFCDGHPYNNNGKRADLNDPTHQQWDRYWGGDLQGVIDKLDYLEELGVTAIWLTPLFEQVEAESENRAPIHGYWARDFKRINSRWVNGEDEVRLFQNSNTVFDRLITALHQRGMKLILDIVCNHSSPQTDSGKGQLFDDGQLVADFHNDVDHWYHHYGVITDWRDDWQVQNGEIRGLATFNENNIYFRRYIRESIQMWLDKGVDALRVDTVKHMPLWFWQEFTADLQVYKPGIFIFGEWIESGPEKEASVTFANKSGMSILDFGLAYAVRRCLGDREPDGFKIVQSLMDQDRLYRSATELVTFFENHDMPRLQTLNGDLAVVEQATALILASRGIPCVYYGSEQYLHNDTDGGNDPYNRPMMDQWDTSTRVFKIVQILAHERKVNQAMQWGGHWPKIVEPDFYVFLRRYRGSRLLMILNKGAEREFTLENSELPEGDHYCLLTRTKITVKEGTLNNVKIKAQAILAFSVVEKPLSAQCIVRFQINGAPTKPGEWVAITGNCPELGDWDIRNAVRLECINANLWFGELLFNESCDRPISYKAVILNDEKDAPPRRENRTARVRGVLREGAAKWRDIWEES